jgi:hypothetical protein
MNARAYFMTCVFLCLPISQALSADKKEDVRETYQEIMRAQFAAHEASPPATPEEAQKIYDAYLQSIGRLIKDQPADNGDTTNPH